MILPGIYFGIIITLVLVKEYKSFHVLVYGYILSSLFNQFSGGEGFNIGLVSNFTYLDAIGFISLTVIFVKIITNSIKFKPGIKSEVIHIFVILITVGILMIISYQLHGSAGLQSNRQAILSFFTLGALAFSLDSEIDYQRIIDNTLKLLAISAIVIYVLRLTSVLDYYSGSYGTEGSYSIFRFLINTQVLYLAFYYIHTVIKQQSSLRVTKFDKVLMYTSALLVIISTQRMITILFVLFLLYQIMFTKSKRFALVTLTSAFIVFILLPNNYVNMISYAFEDVAEYDGSTAESKLKDIPATLIAMYQEGKLIFGNIYSPIWLERSFDDFYSRDTRATHNLFLSYMVNGGLLLSLMVLSLWLKIIYSTFRNYQKLKIRSATKTDSCYVFSILSIIIFLVLFNMSSGVGHLNSLMLAFALGLKSIKPQ